MSRVVPLLILLIYVGGGGMSGESVGACSLIKYVFKAFGITCYNCRNVEGQNSCGDFDSSTPIQVT